MPKGYRKVKYFSREEAERRQDRLLGEAARNCMAGVDYSIEEVEPGCWVVNHYCLRNLTMTEVKNGYMPYDYDEHYLEGYIWNGTI